MRFLWIGVIAFCDCSEPPQNLRAHGRWRDRAVAEQHVKDDAAALQQAQETPRAAHALRTGMRYSMEVEWDPRRNNAGGGFSLPTFLFCPI